MKGEYYRVVIENGKVKINVFEKNNPSPIYSTKAKFESEAGKEIIALFLQKYGVGIKEYKKICENIDKDIQKDINEIFREKK